MSNAELGSIWGEIARLDINDVKHHDYSFESGATQAFVVLGVCQIK
jgi:hypothetical protein